MPVSYRAYSRSLGFCYAYRFPGLQRLPGQLLPQPGNSAPQQSETPQTKSPTPNAAPVAEPIPLNDVAKRLEASRRQIREIR